jgi:glycosyltransferase involved in cell wall biosynthesis
VGVSEVAALIPAYQAAAHLGEVLLRLQALQPAPEVLVVNDGSRDATARVAEEFGARVLSFAGNRGKGHALLAGFDALREYAAVVTLDADGQHPPECLPEFVSAWRAGAQLVLGRRARTGEMPWSRRFANAFSSEWTSWLAGTRISDSQCGYRLYTRAVIEGTPISPGRYELETAIAVRAARLGYRVAEVEIPTVYGEAGSHIRPFHDVPRIVGALGRLTLERALPGPAMRRAARGKA